jgi:hypothetical protein
MVQLPVIQLVKKFLVIMEGKNTQNPITGSYLDTLESNP